MKQNRGNDKNNKSNLGNLSRSKIREKFLLWNDSTVTFHKGMIHGMICGFINVFQFFEYFNSRQ